MSEKLFAGLTYEQTVRKYARTVGGVCLMRLKNYADSEDCFQNVFMKLLSKSPEFTDENHLKAWLIRVAVNECNSFLRKKRRVVSFEEAVREEISFNEDKNDISWALMKTPQKYRETLYLYYCEQYKVKEIAEILEISETAVKARLKRGREKLKAIYGGD